VRYSRADINRIEGKFDSFCKTVLKNRARDWYRKKERQQKREILFSDVSPGLHIEPSCFDYIMCIECQAFYALDRMVMIENDLLANALRMLSPRKRQIILLSYFFGWTDQKIGIRFHTARSTIQAARMRTLQEMREIIENQRQRESGAHPQDRY
jgi:RNA polymerase sigma factor (sigma-70 family)